ncbi:transcriptional regulator [Kiloniella litopenaei]|uniref:Transcriptional regulator n=1 Tax=Kiloniella litopenaei TaxID=1549748 RepID=A0A0M2RE64_9PROT|nr:LysR family transcriptional regulator [Kiloniella litopenaei]KKJ78300.1 transcriptional regulator [Kiloniella litopenaei]
MKRSEIPSLDDIRAFEAVARLGSVKAASEELSLTHGAVSRRITKLSRDIGIKLSEPDGRGIAITRDGEILSKAARNALDELSKAVATIKQDTNNNPIVLSCERSVAMRWLIPRLSHFQDRHPDVELHLSVGGGTLDFKRDRITLAIRRLDFPIDPHWEVDVLMQEKIGPVMKPEMRVHFDNHNYIGLASRTRPDAWETWSRQEKHAPPPREIRSLDHHFLMAEAAANGLGVALCPYVLAIDDIEKGRIVAPMGFKEDGSEYGLIYPRDLVLTKHIHLVKNWLTEIAAAI